MIMYYYYINFQVAANMIGENRLRAYIDQVDGYLHFEEVMNSLERRNERIREICNDVGLLTLYMLSFTIWHSSYNQLCWIHVYVYVHLYACR